MAREAVITSHTNHRSEAVRIMGWNASTPTKTVLVIHHGLGEHIGRYQSLADHLSDVPIHVYGYDAVGHGESGGKRGDAAGFDGLAADLRQMIGVILEASGAEHVILFGHSMGAGVVAHSLATGTPHAAIRGVVLSAPPVEIHRTALINVKIALGRVLARVAPRVTLSNEIDHANISSVQAEIDRYARDPLVHDRISLRLAASLIDEAAALPERVGKVTLPLLLYQGVDDGVVQIRGTRRLAETWGGEVELEEFEGARHETHHETPEIVGTLMAKMREWLTPHLSS
jgi:alpha-beta hydrolase superfamily lysophospholipase